MTDPLHRFDRHARDYARGRPRYPRALGELVRGLGRRVVDVGAGTGLATEVLIDAGCDVIAIEPSDEMRAAARVPMRDGTAERTGLPDHGVDVVFAAQAAHWFDPEPTLREWRRVLAPGGRVVLAWNSRRTDDGFGAELDALMSRYTDHPRDERPGVAARLLPRHEHVELDNPHPVDADTFAAYIGSISYLADVDPAPFLEIFVRHGARAIPQRCDVYYSIM